MSLVDYARMLGLLLAVVASAISIGLAIVHQRRTRHQLRRRQNEIVQKTEQNVRLREHLKTSDEGRSRLQKERDDLETVVSAIEAERLKVKRDGEEYEYDVVVWWGDYIFVFECKNHSLSNRHPIQAYYFELQASSDSKQVKRLAEAVTRYPDILREGLGIDPTDKKIVPCVLNALPYSRPGEEDGVYFTDASSLKRFFGDRYFYLKASHTVEENLRILHRMAMHTLWSGESPIPEDLLRQIEDPFQIKLMLAHTDIVARPFPIAEGHLVVVEDFVRTEMTMESYAGLVGISPDAIRKDSAEVARHVETLKARLKEDRKST